MRAELGHADIGTLLRPLSAADIFARPSSVVLRGALRLEAGFYGSEGYRALQAMEQSGFNIERLSNTAVVTWPGIFSRVYVDDRQAGVPFLTSSTMLSAKLDPSRYLSKSLTAKLDSVLVSSGTLLVSRSGTIGNVAICTSDYHGMAVSEDAIRIDPKDDIDRGLLFVFLLSDLGQFLMTRSKSGSVIEHIYPGDLESISLPTLPKALRRELSKKIQQACDLRVRANALLDESNQLVLNLVTANDLERQTERRWFFRSAAHIYRARKAEGCARLDATYYEPSALMVREALRKEGGNVLRDCVPNVILIGKTFVEGVHKVEREYGVPYFTGKELFTYRPVPETFITSQRRALIDKLLVSRGTVLVTCAGTVGKVMYVRGALENAAVTHDAIRVLPGRDVHPGFVYAFLASALGQLQLQRCSYGSVIPRLYRTHVENILVPSVKDRGLTVGELVDRAFDLRANAMREEGQAVSLFNEAVRKGRSATEEKWGREY